MNDPFERELRIMLDDRARGDPATARMLADGLASLPSRHRWGRGRLGILVAAVLSVALVVVVIPRLAGTGANPWPDPASFAGDPRLAACRSSLPDIDHVFEMRHARWFPRYFTGWSSGAPELEVDDPALVVISKPAVYPHMGVPQLGGPTDGPTGLSPTPESLYMVCIAVGPPDGAITHLYGPTRFETIIPVVPE